MVMIGSGHVPANVKRKLGPTICLSFAKELEKVSAKQGSQQIMYQIDFSIIDLKAF